MQQGNNKRLSESANRWLRAAAIFATLAACTPANQSENIKQQHDKLEQRLRTVLCDGGATKDRVSALSSIVRADKGGDQEALAQAIEDAGGVIEDEGCQPQSR